jgi:hypothetical protein
MTIYSNRPAPAWDKSGEKRIPMTKEMAKKLGAGSIKVAIVVQAKSGLWVFGPREEEKRLRESTGKGRLVGPGFETAAEAVAAAERDYSIIINTAPASAARKKGWELGPAARKVAATVDLAKAEERAAAAHAAAPPAEQTKAGLRVEASLRGIKRAAERAAKPGAKPRGKGIGAFCESLILEGKSDNEVLAAARRQFPDASTKEASIKWYRNKLLKEGRLK